MGKRPVRTGRAYSEAHPAAEAGSRDRPGSVAQGAEGQAIGRQTMRILWLACAIGLAAACLLPETAVQAQSKKAPEDPFFSGPPFTLDDILQRVGVIADKRL